MKFSWKAFGIFNFAAALIAFSLFAVSPPTSLDAQSLAPKIKTGDPLPANLFIELAKAVNPAVVNISTTQMITYRNPYGGPPSGDPMLDLFRQFMGGGSPY